MNSTAPNAEQSFKGVSHVREPAVEAVARVLPESEHAHALAVLRRKYGSARWLLAASGFVMLGFVILHLVGNLLAFAGAAAFNAYAQSIRDLGAGVLGGGTLLLAARLGLATALVLHVAAHLILQRYPEQATDAPRYRAVPPWFATLPVSVLQVTGAVIALFLAVHIGQLTVGALHGAFVPADPYHNLVVALQSWPTATLYVIATLAVGVHLLAGVWTGMNALGWIGPRTQRWADKMVPVVAAGVTVGLSSLPIAIVLRVLT